MTELFDKINLAHKAVRPQVIVSPLTHSPIMSSRLGCEVYLKCEHLQATGSFKFRGATNKIRSLTPEQLRRGVVTASSGNHGQATALAGALAGTAVTVYVASSAAKLKQEAIKALGAELVVLDGSVLDAEIAARHAGEKQGKVYISPYNDIEVLAGQGTLGMELAEQMPDLDAVFMSVGCGGLIGGAGTAIKHLMPQARVVGCWPENAPAMLRSLEEGRIVDIDDVPTLSDGTAGAVEAGSITFPVCQAVIDERVTVSEAEIALAMRQIAETDRWMVEGAAAVSLASLSKIAPYLTGKKVAVVLCGRNIGLETFIGAVSA